jgi:hypothetical protein
MADALQPVASAGKIHLLDITRLKERFGSKWERMAQHVQMFFEAAIRRALKPGDTFCRFEELSYLIMFRELSAAEADFKCAAISEEVCKRLFGENGAQVTLRNLVAHVGLASVPVGATQQADLNALLEREGTETVVTQDGRSGPRSASQRGAERMLRLNPGGGPDSRLRVSSRELTFAYRPIWDSINRVVLTYLCQPVLRSVQPAADVAAGFCTADDEGDQAFLDECVLRECVERSTRLRAAGLRIILAVPVHFTSVAHPRMWRDYSGALRQIPDEIARDFAFVVFGIDHGVPHIRLAQELPKLSKRAYRVFCAIDRWQGAGARFAGTGAHGVGAALAEKEDELHAISRLREVAREAQSAAIDSFVLGLRSTSLALISIHSGIRYLEGPVVRPAVDDPRHGFAQGVEDLYTAKRAVL